VFASSRKIHVRTPYSKLTIRAVRVTVVAHLSVVCPTSRLPLALPRQPYDFPFVDRFRQIQHLHRPVSALYCSGYEERCPMPDDFQIPASNYLHDITRLTLLFDVAQSFNSTIQTRELAPTICNRTANVMDAKSCALWLVEKPNMVCSEVYGHYRSDLPGK